MSALALISTAESTSTEYPVYICAKGVTSTGGGGSPAYDEIDIYNVTGVMTFTGSGTGTGYWIIVNNPNFNVGDTITETIYNLKGVPQGYQATYTVTIQNVAYFPTPFQGGASIDSTTNPQFYYQVTAGP